MDNWNDCFVSDLIRYIGQTVTVFTESGGISGSGFTGVLLSVDCKVIRLLACIGEAPCCPVGSACTNDYNRFGNTQASAPFFGNPLGGICVIPVHAIVCFTHNAVGAVG